MNCYCNCISSHLVLLCLYYTQFHISHCMMGLGKFGIESEQSGFTPVRRPESTINSRLLNGEPEKEWTATRCNRLLRALTSRVALLKRDLSRMQNGALLPNTNTKAILKRKSAKDVDEEWKNGNYTKKRVKRTYSGRQGRVVVAGRTQSQTCSQEKSNARFVAGEISVPTPFLNLAGGSDVTTDAFSAVPVLHDHSQNDTHTSEFQTKRRYRKEELAQYQHQYNTYMYKSKKNCHSFSVYGIYEGIYNGLESLLRATTSDAKLSSKGARSLFGICLRAVPRYILDEEKLLENELAEAKKGRTIDSPDVSTEIYDDLESLGSSGRGWKHLRTVVRSHGVQVLREAMAAGLLETEFCSILINLCFQNQATVEGETLLSALISTAVFPPPPSILTHAHQNNTTLPLSLLWNTAEPGVSASFQFKQLSGMIANDQLPLSWLATRDFSPVWTKAIQELSSQTINAEISHFLIVALERLTTLPTEKHEQEVHQTFSSILNTISSIVIVSRETETYSHDSCVKPELFKYDHIIRLLRSCLMKWENLDGCNTNGALLLLANISVGSLSDDTHSELCLAQHLLEEIRKDKGLVSSDLVTFICSIARCCGRAMSTKGFEYLKQLHSTLESLPLTREPTGGNLLHELIVDSSFAFAQQASDFEFLDYATSVEAKFHVVKTRQVFGETPSRSGGFRWEDGISEWVSATPAVNKSRLAIGARNIMPDCASSICDSPIRPQAKRSNSMATNLSTLTPLRLQTKIFDYSHGSSITSSSSDVNEAEVSLMGQQSPNSSFATTISTSSQSSIGSMARYQRTTCGPGFNKKISKTASQKWDVFDDESDDELSFCDTSSHGEHALQSITNVSCLNKQRPAIELSAKSKMSKKRTVSRSQRRIEDSEDELGM